MKYAPNLLDRQHSQRGDVFNSYRKHGSMWGEELSNELIEALSGRQCPDGLSICARTGVVFDSIYDRPSLIHQKDMFLDPSSQSNIGRKMLKFFCGLT